jgi:hypothetical protein
MTHRNLPARRPSLTLAVGLTAIAALSLSACSSMDSGMASKPVAQTDLPPAVQVPAGHAVALETVGTGRITYECRAKKDMVSEQEWAFIGPDAQLTDRKGQRVGRYWGPPATWEHSDGSKVTAVQVAVAPAGTGHIPLQLVKANPATGMGTLRDVSYIQRVATRGGVAPALPCTSAQLGQKQEVSYQADYIFWAAR